MFRSSDRTLSSSISTRRPEARSTLGRHRFVLALLAATAFAGPASAQLQWAPTLPQPGQAAVDPTLASQDEKTIAGLSCMAFSPDIRPSNAASPYGVPEERWTRELFQILQARLATCTAAWDLNNRSFARSVLNNWGEDMILRAQNKRRVSEEASARKRALLAQLGSASQMPSSHMQFDKITEVERMAAMSRLTPADQAEISAAISQFRAQAEELRQREVAAQEEQERIRRDEAARAEQRRQQDAAAEAERAKARQEELAAKAREEEQAFQERLSKFSAPVRAFVSRNPGVATSKENEASTILFHFYTFEVALRVCGSKFGSHRTELAEMTRRRKLIEQTLLETQGWPDGKLKDWRAKAGVESGRGPTADLVAADRIKLIQMCDAALASTWGALHFD